MERQFYPLQGGLDLTTPSIQTPGGRAIAAYNYESHPRGYQRIDGYERIDGRPKPSEAAYWIVHFEGGSSAVVEGKVVQGQTSFSSGILLVDPIIESGSWAGGDAAGYLVLWALEDDYQDGETLRNINDGIDFATSTSASLYRGALNDTDDQTWYTAAVNAARALIAALPGSGPVRGVWEYKNEKYAVRDNAGGTAGVLYKSDTGGWQAQSFGLEIAFHTGGIRKLDFTSGGTYQVTGADVIEGMTSGATATVFSVTLTSGTWAGGDAAGYFLLINQNELPFQSENLKVGDADPNVATVSGDSEILDIEDGDTITGASSGATAVVDRAVVESGDWSTRDAEGRLVLKTTQTGSFTADEDIRVGGIVVGTVEGNSTAITLPPGGRYFFDNYNFSGRSDQERMYGVNGVGFGFEWDGEILVPIHTGMGDDDKPIRLGIHRNHLFFAFPGGSLQHSSIRNPYEWQIITGAGELGIGSEISDLLPSVSSAMVIFSTDKVAVLYGDDASNWILKVLTDDSGAMPYTAQMIGSPMYMDNVGIRSVDTTEQFGDFNIGTITRMVEPIFRENRRRGIEPVASMRVRAKDMYRLYFSDGSGLAIYFGREAPEVMPFKLPFAPTCAVSGKKADGGEILLVGAPDGFVYELDKGTSFDGDPIQALCRLPFNHIGDPTRIKRWMKAIVEVDGGPTTELGIISEFSYADPYQPPSVEYSFNVRGAGGFWDDMRWDEFYWSTPIEGRVEAFIDGLGRNMSIAITSESATEDAHVLQGLIIHFANRGIDR